MHSSNLQIFGTSPFAPADFEAFSTICTGWFWGPVQRNKCCHANNYELLLIPLLAHTNSFLFYFWLVPFLSHFKSYLSSFERVTKSQVLQIIFLMLLKFRFSKKATKFETISHMIWCLLCKCQIKWEIVSNFCGLFRMSELYSAIFHMA